MESKPTSVSEPLYYQKTGSGPAVILLHGFPESGTLWNNIWPELSGSATLIIPDLPGCGNSIQAGYMTISQMADLVKDIMDNEGIDKAIIAGHSMGGYVAFAFANSYPSRVSGLALVHSTPLADDEDKKKMRTQSIGLVQKGAKNLLISQMIPNLFADSFKQSHPEIVKEQTERSLQMADQSIINFNTAMMARKAHTDVLDRAVFPLQWVLGINDNLIPYKKILQHCYRSDINFVSFYNNCGHMSMLEAPEMLIADMKKFINYCYPYHNS